MFGVGPQELLIIGLLFLVIFGPTKATSMARDLGRFVSGAQRTVEELKEELVPEEVDEARRAAKEVKNEARRSIEGLENEAAPSEESR